MQNSGNRNPKPKGEGSPTWKGYGANIRSRHLWISRHYGNPRLCEHCLTKTAKRYEWANISGKYKRKGRSDYLRLCKSCHVKYDRKEVCRRGHPFTESNLYIFPSGVRTCRKCKTEANKAWKARNRKHVNKLHNNHYWRHRKRLRVEYRAKRIAAGLPVRPVHQPPLGA